MVRTECFLDSSSLSIERSKLHDRARNAAREVVWGTEFRFWDRDVFLFDSQSVDAVSSADRSRLASTCRFTIDLFGVQPDFRNEDPVSALLYEPYHKSGAFLRGFQNDVFQLKCF